MQAWVQHGALTRCIRGHFNDYGVNGNGACLVRLLYHAQWARHKWLNRRSQKTRMSWERFAALSKAYPLPKPRITVQMW